MDDFYERLKAAVADARRAAAAIHALCDAGLKYEDQKDDTDGGMARALRMAARQKTEAEARQPKIKLAYPRTPIQLLHLPDVGAVHGVLVALCDDGTIWCANARELCYQEVLPTSAEVWVCLPTVPQEKPT